MNETFLTSCLCLELDPHTFTIESLKRQYRMMALKYHPDKNPCENASHKFQEVNNAYNYLKKYNSDEDEDSDTGDDNNTDNENDPSDNNCDKKQDTVSPKSYYGNILHSFIRNILSSVGDDTKNTLICSIISKIMDIGETHSLEYLKKIDKHVLVKIYDIMCKYKDVFHLSDSFLEKIKELVAFKFENDECIILNPFIDDLLNDNLYKLRENGNTYIVPLWHHELVYDNSGADLYVKCIPLLPENMVIDENNNIHMIVKWEISRIWEKYEIPIFLGTREFHIQIKDIRVLKNQCITLREMGISRVNTKNIYDVSRRADILVHIELLLQ